MKTVCIICGAEFKEGIGWVKEHDPRCANKRYGWYWTIDVEDKQHHRKG